MMKWPGEEKPVYHPRRFGRIARMDGPMILEDFVDG
jgi:hypothetical protein